MSPASCCRRPDPGATAISLAPDELQGQYQGLFSMSYGIANMLAPVIVTTIVIGGGLFGWLLIGAMFLVVGLAMGPLGRWAEANRPLVPVVMSRLVTMKLLLIGPPGSGKGTQGELLCEQFGLAHIAAGDLLRAEVEAGTPLGKEVADYLDRGELVPDELVIELIMPLVVESVQEKAATSWMGSRDQSARRWWCARWRRRPVQFPTPSSI